MARRFGAIKELPSGRFHASYPGPDGSRHNAPSTFDTREDAVSFLDDTERDVRRGRWQPVIKATPKKIVPAETFGRYAKTWLANRQQRDHSTREHNQGLLDRHLYPTFEDVPITDITATMVDDWYAKCARGNPGARKKIERTNRDATRAHAYGLLASIMRTAVRRKLIAESPCQVERGRATPSKRKMHLATAAEVQTIAADVPDRYQAMVLLATWCALRFGEVAGLQRKHVDLDRVDANGDPDPVIKIRHQAIRTGEFGDTKTASGVRDVPLVPHMVPVVRDHLTRFVGPKRDALLFPATTRGDRPIDRPIAHKPMWTLFDHARNAAGRGGKDGLTFHDLRHTGATWYATAGGNLREIMNFIGDSSPTAALRYLHEVDGRPRAIANRMGDMFGAPTNVTPIRSRRSA